MVKRNIKTRLEDISKLYDEEDDTLFLLNTRGKGNNFFVDDDKLTPQEKEDIRNSEITLLLYRKESNYLCNLRDIGYKYYEDDFANADDKNIYVEDDEPIEFSDSSEKIDIKELLDNSDGFKAIVTGITPDAIKKCFMDSSDESKKAFTKELENTIKSLEDHCIIIEKCLIDFSTDKDLEKYGLLNDKHIRSWTYKLNKIQLEKLREISMYNNLLNRLIDYLEESGIVYKTKSRKTFGTIKK